MHMLDWALYELQSADGAVAMISQARAIEASRDPPAACGPGNVVISVEDDERRRSNSACVSDLMSWVEILRCDLTRRRAEADERIFDINLAEAREREVLDASWSEVLLKERVREWEDFHEESKRLASRKDEEARPTREEPRDGYRDAQARKLARAQADGRSASDSASSQVGDGQGVVWVRESSNLDFPKQSPTVTNLNEWKIKVALALVQSTGYGDPKEVQRFLECNDATRSFGSFDDSDGNRYTALDDKLGHAMLSVAATNPMFRRELERISRRESSKGRLLTGRHMRCIVHRQLKVNEDL